MKVYINTDGGSRGNPGPAAIAAVIKDEGKKKLREVGVYIGVATNNEAEYKALIEGLKSAKELGALMVDCFLDSELVVKQLNGQYKVKNPKIRVWWQEIKAMEPAFKSVSYRHIPREENSEADALVNKVLDSVNSYGAKN
jgi:ribonuclease HI